MFVGTSTSWGNRTPVCGLKNHYPPIRRTRHLNELFQLLVLVVSLLVVKIDWLLNSVSSRIGSAKWSGRRSNPRHLGFNQVLYRLSYRTVYWGDRIELDTSRRNESSMLANEKSPMSLTPGFWKEPVRFISQVS